MSDADWTELQVVIARSELDKTNARLFELGCSGVQEDFVPGETPPPRQPWDTGPDAPLPQRALVKAWFQQPDRAAIEAAIGGEVRWSSVPDTDWDALWKASFAPIVISERLVVAPPWDAPEGALLIEPGQGFGSGQHASTKGALQFLDRLADTVETVLDIGCGSGVLALAAAKLGCQAEGIDIEQAAIRDAHAQAVRNGIEGVRFSTTPVSALRSSADLVLANLFAEALVGMANDLVRLTGKHLVLAGVLVEREQLVRDVLDPHLSLTERVVDGEWVAMHYEVRP